MRKHHIYKTISTILCLLFIITITGCGTFVNKVTNNLAENLAMAISNNNDLQTVKDGCPAYLLMIDAFVKNDPDNGSMLRTAADLYSTYSSFFVTDNKRALKLTNKALHYALLACCNENNKPINRPCGLNSSIIMKITNFATCLIKILKSLKLLF